METLKAGLDIGSLYIHMVFEGYNGNTPDPIYAAHHGKVKETLKEELLKRNIDGRLSLSIVDNPASDSSDIFPGIPKVDYIRALITDVKAIYPDASCIIDIGGGSVSLIELTEEGTFRNCQTNSLCAAGTGSFLDEQAERLGIDYTMVRGENIDDNPPPIASRCSVFAKSDLIHRQQEGYSKMEMWSGLCKSMTETMLNTLLKGKPLNGQTVITGGVAQNPYIIHWLRKKFGDLIQTFSQAHLASCSGAIMLMQSGATDSMDYSVSELFENIAETGRNITRRKPLNLIKSIYPEPLKGESYIDESKNEVFIGTLPDKKELAGYLGIDIGSTSTKLLFMDDEKNVILTIYRKTLGDPISAVKKLFIAMLDIEKSKNFKWKILGCSTTGSGRKLIGKIIGGDLIVNEISAHVRGAMEVDPTIDTIFEIGGQDSKYMHTRNGKIYDSNMNYICAAGTGSFVEEICRKLSIPLDFAGDSVMGVEPPFTSDRCTVFMEQDMLRLLQKGHDREECLAAIMYSVILNYMNKVVGNRYYSKKKVFFQGATARNKGLVAAFENLLNVEVVVSPLCHVMGCYGLTLLLKEKYDQKQYKTTFKGLDLHKRKIELTSEICKLCNNNCTITYAHIENSEDVPSWGYLCGRDPNEKIEKKNDNFNLYDYRIKQWRNIGRLDSIPADRKVVGIPRTLTTYGFLPLFNRFFNELGYRVKISPQTNDKIREYTSQLVGADFCFPAKIAHGHVSYLNDQNVNYIFTPFMISNKKNEKAVNNVFCPYVESMPSYVSTSFELNNIKTDKLLKPVVDFRWNVKTQAKEFFKAFGQKLNLTVKDIEKAWIKALAIQDEYETKMKQECKSFLQKVQDQNKPTIVIIGRPYNTMDFGINLSLPKKLSELGFPVVPMDNLDLGHADLPDEFNSVYWDYGQKILTALKYVREHDNLFALYFTNFSCGPDSFILSFAEEVMGDKPFLTLELDEHSSDGGYMTRIEAFADVINEYVKSEDSKADKSVDVIIPQPDYVVDNAELKRRKIWIPPMHAVGSRMFAAAFKRFGYDSEELPLEDVHAFDIGRKETRGSECLPTACTIGALLSTIEKTGGEGKDHAFFMPTAEGPCRFGQYATLHRIIMNRNNLSDLLILSPSSINNYLGIEEKLRRYLWEVIIVQDMLFKIQCRLRPYEKVPGQVNEVMEQSVQALERDVVAGKDIEPIVDKIISDFEKIEIRNEKKPLVGIVGEIYVRCNAFSNDFVIESIEKLGGEAWLSPISEWILYTNYINAWMLKNYPSKFWERIIDKITNSFMSRREHFWQHKGNKLLEGRQEPPIADALSCAEKYIPYNFLGEAILTIGRTIKYAEEGADMVVNCAPFGCMPGTISASIFQKLQNEYNIPIVSQFYDGEGGLNKKLSLYLNNIKPAKASKVQQDDLVSV